MPLLIIKVYMNYTDRELIS